MTLTLDCFAFSSGVTAVIWATDSVLAAGSGLAISTGAGVAAFSKTLSREIPANSNLTINTILTGGCKTDRLYSLIQHQAKNNDESPDDLLKQLSKTVPVGYFATPNEFSKTVLFLASDEASYINGVALPLDGGSLKGVF